MSRMNNKRAAVSLVESIAAIFFLILIVGPLASLFSHSIAGTVLNRDEMLANDYASDLIAVARSLPYDDLPVAERLHMNFLVVDNYNEKALEPGFNRFLTVHEFTGVSIAKYNYKTLVVEVEWSSSGVQRSIKMPGLIMRANTL